MTFGPRTRISPSETDFREGVASHDRRGFRQAVALEYDQPDGMKELGDVPGQGRAAGNKELHPAAGFLQDFRKNELLSKAEAQAPAGEKGGRPPLGFPARFSF